MIYPLLLGLPGLALLVVAAMLLGAGPVGWVAGPGALWVGLSLVTLGILYAAGRSGRAWERCLEPPRSSAGTFALLVLVPYSVFTFLALLLLRVLSSERLADPVHPRILVGGAPLPWDGRRLLDRGVDAVLNLTVELGDTASLRRHPGVVYRRTPLLDGAAPVLHRLGEAVSWAEENWREGRTIYVHCAQGHGRSGTVAAALLVRLGLAATAEEALGLLRGIRPGIRLHPGQRDALERLLGAQESGSL